MAKFGAWRSCASVVALATAAGFFPQFAQAADGDSASSSASATTLETVVVTARKREEALQDVPLSLTAVNSSALERSGAVNLSDISRMVPNVYFSKVDPSIPFLYIRGIGSRNFDPGTDEPVGVFIDGVYQARMGGFQADLFDVERVEVLRGPQGTLYGKNTIGGAISIVTKDPTDVFTAKAMAEVGEGETGGDMLWGVSGEVSGPITDGISASLAVVHRQRDGWSKFREISERGGSDDTTGVHGKVLIDLGSSAILRVSASYIDESAAPLALRMYTFGGLHQPYPLPPGKFFPPFSSDPYVLDGNVNGIVTKRIPSVSATLDWNWSDIAFTSITAWQAENLFERYDADGSTLDVAVSSIGEVSHQISEEFRATGAGFGDRLTWLAGLYAGREFTNRLDETVYGLDSLNAYNAGLHFGTGPEPLDRQLRFGLKTTTLAAFGQLDYKVTNDFTITLGGRYSHDEKDAHYALTVNPLFLFVPYTLTVKPQTWSSFDPMATLSYKITPDIMAYGTVTSGYKSGAFQYNVFTAKAAGVTVNPEHVRSYEAGLKTTLLDGRLRANLAAFHMDYKDLQVLNFVTVAGTPIAVISNAARSTISGFELETELAIDENWRVGVNYATLDAAYDHYIAPAGDFSGNRMQFAPKQTADINVDYDKQYSFGLFDGHVGFSWRDKVFELADNNKIDTNAIDPPVGLVDASFSLTNGPYKMSLWGTNLADQRYRNLVIAVTGLAQRQIWAAPRTIGVRLNVEY